MGPWDFMLNPCLHAEHGQEGAAPSPMAGTGLSCPRLAQRCTVVGQKPWRGCVLCWAQRGFVPGTEPAHTARSSPNGWLSGESKASEPRKAWRIWGFATFPSFPVGTYEAVPMAASSSSQPN